MMRIMARLFRLAFSLCELFPLRNRIVFVSRQSPRPLDFSLLEPALRRAFPEYEVVWACVPAKGSFGAVLALKQLWYVATSRVCFADGYIPAVCIPRTKRAYCVQIWHALGAIKKFGYQALDTPDGRSSRAARDLSMHRGYDLIVAGLPGAVPSFAEAFDCPRDRVVPLGLPRIDYLTAPEFREVRNSRADRARKALGSTSVCEEGAVVLYAPTLRRGVPESDSWFSRLVEELEDALTRIEPHVALVVAGHPLQSGVEPRCEDALLLKGVPTIDAIEMADYVVTDYSAVAFEAALLKKNVLFYVPDVREYRVSPGLNIDPLEEFPDIAFERAPALAQAIENDQRGRCIPSFDEYLGSYLGVVDSRCTERIVARVRDAVGVYDGEFEEASAQDAR